jgi:hypothetical protein
MRGRYARMTGKIARGVLLDEFVEVTGWDRKHANNKGCSNEGTNRTLFFYQINYTIGDKHPADVGRLHTLFRRENLTTLKQDFELLPKREGKGRFLGSIIGVRALQREWWGEGEVKVFMDGDKEFLTICGT